ncbi:hypothetical protein ACFFR8_02190 [Streptoalloteichus tenebrarius]
MALLVTAGQRGANPQVTTVIEVIRVPVPDAGRPRARPDRVLAGRAYICRADRASRRQWKIKASIDHPA